MGIEFTNTIRKARGKFETQSSMAKALGISGPTLCRWLKGSSPSYGKAIDVLARIKAKKGAKKC
jgi:hypothetical protein